MPKYYPDWVCAKCAARYGRKRASIASWHHGTCGVCLDDGAVTEPRDYGHLHDDWREQYDRAKMAIPKQEPQT